MPRFGYGPKSRVEVIAGYEPPFSRGASGCDETLTLSVVGGSERRWETERGRVLADSNIKSPDLSFVVPAANENRWSGLLATLISTDPDRIAGLLQIECDSVRREVVVPGLAGRRSDRLDLLLQSAGRGTAAIEVKLLSDLGPRQLERYRAAFPAVETHRVLHLDTLPVNLRGVASWESLTWESVLTAYAASEHPWVSATARAWRTQLASLVPVVNENTVWNDVPDEPAAMELELRARVTWLSRQMDFWCTLERDMVPSSGGGNWVARMWAPASAPGHHVTAELQERYVGLRMASRPQASLPRQVQRAGGAARVASGRGHDIGGLRLEAPSSASTYSTITGRRRTTGFGRPLLLGQRIRATERTGRASSRQELPSGSARAGA
jgi:hypothetical protein